MEADHHSVVALGHPAHGVGSTRLCVLELEVGQGGRVVLHVDNGNIDLANLVVAILPCPRFSGGHTPGSDSNQDGSDNDTEHNESSDDTSCYLFPLFHCVSCRSESSNKS